jgi:glycosyltransferase involved in cell wall biosynthesis
MAGLSVVLATFNEEKNIKDCLQSVKSIADEVIIVDGSSSDKTVEIAKKLGAKVIITDNPPIFHINKQKALEEASSDWILQLDADERVSTELGQEILQIITKSNEEISRYQKTLREKNLFNRHQQLIEKRDGEIGNNSSRYAAFFIPRLNYFLGKYLRYGGVYPDGVIRLVRKDQAHFPCKSVHEQIAVNGKVGWLQNPLYHIDSPTFKRYIERNNRYINLMADQLSQKNQNPFTPVQYLLFSPIWWFILTFIRHKGFLDSWQGLVFSFFSSLRFPRAYLKYLENSKKLV